VLRKNVSHLMRYFVLILAVGIPPLSLAAPTCALDKIEKTGPNYWTIGTERFEVGEEKSDSLRQIRDKSKNLAQSAPFLSTTGGIAFEAVAVPAPDLKEQPVKRDSNLDKAE